MTKKILDFCGTELHYHGSSDRAIYLHKHDQRISPLFFSCDFFFLVNSEGGVSVLCCGMMGFFRGGHHSFCTFSVKI